jgi:hypothetical protein
MDSSPAGQSRMQSNLVDRYHLLLDPAVLGNGKRLYRIARIANLILAEAMAFFGIMALTYYNDKKSGVAQIDHSPTTYK